MDPTHVPRVTLAPFDDEIPPEEELLEAEPGLANGLSSRFFSLQRPNTSGGEDLAECPSC